MEKASGYANTESGEQSRLVIENLRVFRVCEAFKVMRLNEVTNGVSIDREQKIYTSEVREGFMKEAGVMLGMLGHLEFDLARTAANSSNH